MVCSVKKGRVGERREKNLTGKFQAAIKVPWKVFHILLGVSRCIWLGKLSWQESDLSKLAINVPEQHYCWYCCPRRSHCRWWNNEHWQHLSQYKVQSKHDPWRNHLFIIISSPLILLQETIMSKPLIAAGWTILELGQVNRYNEFNFTVYPVLSVPWVAAVPTISLFEAMTTN